MGVGGVGSWAVEALARCGVAALVLIDLGKGQCRMGGSILSNLGLSELISHTPDEYTDLCVRLSQDLAWKQNLQQKIALNLASYQSRPKAMTASIEKQLIKLLKQKK